MIVVGPVVDDLSRFRVIGWAGEWGAWVDPAAMSNERCAICDAEDSDEES